MRTRNWQTGCWSVAMLTAASAVTVLAAPALAVTGALDTGFDSDGKQTVDFSTTSDRANAVAIQPADGKIVMAGGNGADGGFALARLGTTGSLDTSFDSDGKVTTQFGAAGVTDEMANAVAVYSSGTNAGKIVAAGVANRGFALARYNTDGSLDTSCDTDGKMITNFKTLPSDDPDSYDEAKGVAIDGNGKIVLVGGSDGDFAMARYNSDCSLDTSFGGPLATGRVITDMGFVDNEQAKAVVILSDLLNAGKIVVAGNTGVHGTVLFGGNGSDTDFALARYTADGILDPTFGLSGRMITDLGYQDGANALAVEADGDIIAAGTAIPIVPKIQVAPVPEAKFEVDFAKLADFAVVRYTPNGVLDPTFGNLGRVLTDFNSGYDDATSIVVQGDGKIVAAGRGGATSATNDYAIARYTSTGVPAGVLDTTFDGDGKLTTDLGGSDFEQVNGLALQSNGKLVVVGGGGSGKDFTAARYDMS